jgi:UDP-glucose 4-epimerase
LAEGHEVDVVDNLSSGSLANLSEARAEGAGGTFRFHHLDIRDEELAGIVVRRRPEVIFHLAAQASVPISVREPVLDAEVNIIGTLRVLEAARAAKTKKIVYAASGGTLYGPQEESDLPIPEHAPHNPRSPYGVSKKAAIDYMVAYRDLHGLEFTALALANAYGPRQNPHGEAGVVAIFAAKLVAGEPCVINGDGGHTRDYVYVDDVVDAFARAAKRGGGLVLNVGTGIETSTSDLYRQMAEAFGTSAPPRHGPERSGDTRRNALDPDRASIHLGWKPWTSVRDGVERVIDEHRQAAR